MIRLGVTGTDTGVGKTVVSRAVIAALRGAGHRVAAMKPVESGGTADAELLRDAAGAIHPMRLVGPVSLPDPLAPLLAARRANTPVDMAVLDDAFAELCSDSDAIVVEGAGGLLVPITETDSFETLFQKWDLDLVIVAPNRLGTINHTLLTIAAANARGLRIRAVVLNTVTAQPPDEAERTNLQLLQELLPSVRIVPFGFVKPGDTLPHINLNSLGIEDVI
jgi:dethiobiotin synthetase